MMLCENRQIYIDVDGVCADFIEAARRTIVDVGGLDAWTDDYFHSWGFIWDGTLPKAIHDEVNLQLNDQRWWNTIPVLPGVVAAYRKLVSVVDIENIAFVTAPSDYCSGWADTRKRWLSRELGVPPRQVVVGTDKHKWLGDGIFIEDRPDTLSQWVAQDYSSRRLGFCVHSTAFDAQLARLTSAQRTKWNIGLELKAIRVVDSLSTAVDFITAEVGDE